MSGFTYPLAFPTETGVRGATLRYNKVVGLNTAPGSLVSQAYEWPGERWEADIDLPVMNRARAAMWESFLLSLRGPVGSFLLTPLNGGTPRGSAATAAGTPQVDGIQAAFSRTLAIKTSLSGVAGYLLRGDWLQLGSGATARLHKVLSDTTLVSGKATLDIIPPLRAAVAANDAIVLVNAVGKFMLTTGNVQQAIDNAYRATPASITIVEDLRPL